MRKILFWCTAFLCFPAAASLAQEEATGHFRTGASENEKYYLEEYAGHKVHRIDSAFTDDNGNIYFRFPVTFPQGMYRLAMNREQGLDFLYTGSSFDIKVDKDFTLEGVDVLSGAQNQIFYQYLRIKNNFERKLSALDQLLAMYPEEDDFFKLAVTEFEMQGREYEHRLDSLLTLTPGSLAATIIRWDQLPDLEPGALEPGSRDILRGHYFDQAGFDDERIVRTPVLPIKVIDYLSLYIIPGTQRERQEALFIQGVDSLMAFTRDAPAIRQAVIEYILEGFERYGFEKVITHIGEHYVLGQSCVSEQEEGELRKRIEGFTKMAAGQMAPPVRFVKNGEMTAPLDDIDEPYRLLFFWASWCPHCTSIVPSLRQLYQKYDGDLEIIAISVDDDEQAWEQAEAEHDFPWPSYAELEGWDGKVISDYYVYATPSLFLLDDQRRIIARPASVDEIIKFLEAGSK